MLALCLMLSGTYYAQNYAGIIDTGLALELATPLGVGSKNYTKQQVTASDLRNCFSKTIFLLHHGDSFILLFITFFFIEWNARTICMTTTFHPV